MTELDDYDPRKNAYLSWRRAIGVLRQRFLSSKQGSEGHVSPAIPACPPHGPENNPQ